MKDKIEESQLSFTHYSKVPIEVITGCDISQNNPKTENEFVNLASRYERPQEVIPPQLRIDGFRFVLLRKKDKPAIEEGWNKDKNYRYDDPKLLEYIRAGHNYGVIPSSDNLCIVDADDYERLNQLGAIDIFSNTFTVRTGNPDADRYHYYFRCEGIGEVKKIPFSDPVVTKKHLGEIFCPGCSAYVVGPGCIHPSGRVYQIVNDVEIASIDIETLGKEFFSKVKSSRTKVDDSVQCASKIPESHNPIKNKLTDQLGLRIEELAMPINAKRRGDEYQGAHPVHGSTTGKNFSINTKKNVFFCHRCGFGGDPITWIAIKEGFIRCDEAESIKIEGELFTKVTDLLCEKYGYSNEIKKIKDKSKEKSKELPVLTDEQISQIKKKDHKNPKLKVKNLSKNHFICQYIKYGELRSDAYPEYYHSGGLFLLSVVADRKAVINFSYGPIYPNIWAYNLGISTISRKTTAIVHTKSFAEEIRSSQQLPQSFSPESFIEALNESPHAWLAIDEAAQILAAMRKSYMTDMRDIFCQLYDNGRYHRKLRGRKGSSTFDFNIQGAYISQMWATTPSNFAEYTDTLDLTSGWLVRYIYFWPDYHKNSRPFETNKPEISQYETIIKTSLSRLAEIFDNIDRPLEFRLEDKALEYFQEWQLRIEDILQKEKNEIASAIYGRLFIVAIKIAMLYKIGSPEFSENMQKWKSEEFAKGVFIPIIIDEVYIKEAINEIDTYFFPIAVNIASLVTSTKSSNLQTKIIGILCSYGGVMGRRELMRMLHIKVKELDEALGALEKSEEIGQYKTDTKKEMIYLIDDKEEEK